MKFLGSFRKGDSYWGGGNIKDPVKIAPGVDTATTPEEVIARRKNAILAARWDQLKINLLGLKGGRPYVEERLSRFSAESTMDWEGGKRPDGTTVTGRKDRSHNVPLLGRLATKVNQYVFSDLPNRDGADPEVLKKISSDGLTIDQFMANTSELLTSCGWCWISVDAPQLDPGTTFSKQDKADQNIRPYWNLWNPMQVVDWYINGAGVLEWLMTDTIDTDASQPLSKPSRKRVRRLWQPGKVIEFTFDGTKGAVTAGKVTELSLTDQVPFFPVGNVSPEPIGFDDLESINRTIMDLESCNRENFFKTVYAQMYLPASALQNVVQFFQVSAGEAADMVRGLGYPVMLNPDDAPPGLIMPDAAALKTIREEITELKAAMFETFGVTIRKQTKQVESAEAKAWDHQDIEAVMREYSSTLQDAEEKAVALSKAWDPDFKTWEPKYSTEFDVGDFGAEVQALVTMANVAMPDEMYKDLLRSLVDRKDQLGDKMTPERRKEVYEAIENFTTDRTSSFDEI